MIVSPPFNLCIVQSARSTPQRSVDYPLVDSAPRTKKAIFLSLKVSSFACFHVRNNTHGRVTGCCCEHGLCFRRAGPWLVDATAAAALYAA